MKKPDLSFVVPFQIFNSILLHNSYVSTGSPIDSHSIPLAIAIF